MKKVLVLLALLAAVCGLLTFSAAAESAVVESGTCGENLTWTLDAAGTLTVSGTGAMEDFSYSGGTPWHQSRSSIKAVVIESGVTSIGGFAFYGCSSLTSITLPQGLTAIGDRAFQFCSCLTGITIPEGVTTIGGFAFSGCSSLISITLPQGLTAIGDRAFQFCSCLTSITIPEGVTAIGEDAFYGCSSLTSITIPEGVTAIGEDAFYGCSSLTSITIPESVTAIGDSAFYGCSSLISITIPEGVTAIGYRAFSGCSSLSSITIPEGVTTIGGSAFSGCSSLKDVSITDLAAWCSIAFGNKEANPLYKAKNLYLNGQKLVSVAVPGGVTEVKAYTFCGFKDLIQVTLPEGVTAIGYSAFSDCSSLTSITIPEGVTTIGGSAFSGCSSLTGITIPKSVTAIGEEAFHGCTGLSSITIPEGVTTIGEYAFYRCSSLSSITLPEGVTTIGEYAFDRCGSLKDVYITDLAAWCSIAFGDETANPLYEAENLYLNGELVETLEIPEGVTVIRQGLFRNAACIRRVALPKSLKGVLANAFYGCKKIQEVFYAGSEAEWNALPIATGNDPLKNATIYFNSTIDDYYCRITVVASEGGRVAVSANTAKAGDTVTVTATPYRGYVMSAIYVDGAEISGDTFTVTGNHRVSAVFTRLPIVGGNEDFRLEGITVLDGAGNPLQELPAERLLVTVTVRHLKESGSGAVMLAQYDERGRYQGLLWLTLEEMPQGMTLKVTLPVDNTGGSIAQLKVFLVESLLSPVPVGEAISFGTI